MSTYMRFTAQLAEGQQEKVVEVLLTQGATLSEDGTYALGRGRVRFTEQSMVFHSHSVVALADLAFALTDLDITLIPVRPSLPKET